MNKSITKIAIFLILFVGINLNIAFANNKEDLLFISSYSPGFISFDEHIEGIKSSLGEDANLIVQYMGYDSIKDTYNEPEFFNMIKSILANYDKIEAILVGDDEALEFCLNYKDTLFKDIPIVFFAIGSSELTQRAMNYDLVTGVIELESVDSNIELIKKFHKNVDNIVFVHGYDQDIIINRYYKEAIEKHDDLKFSKIITKDMSTKEFINKLKDLDENTAILLCHPNILKDRVSLTHKGLVDIISENASNIPIYNIISYGIGDGSLGGKVVNHFEQGKKAGEIVNKVLAGENPKDLYIDDDSVNPYMFDYKKLQEFDISLSSLPKDSIIINHPIDLFKENKVLALGILLIILSLLLIIIALVSYIMHRRKYILKISEARKAAEEANEMKSSFISNISHELKTPLTVIMSVVQVFNHRNNNSISSCDSCQNNINIINNNCNRLIRLLNNIIDVEKFNSNEMSLSLKTINIIELIEDTTLSVITYANAKDLDLIFDCDCEEVIMDVDVEKIERIILNLLSNAIKFSTPNSNIYVNTYVQDKTLTITVKDEGIGIEQDKQNQIFERFVQIDNSLTRKNEGSGIGLSIVKSFVELHKGSISVYSESNKGTSFNISLPIEYNESNNTDIYKVSEEDININTITELSDIYL